jgi:hypothetical protein
MKKFVRLPVIHILSFLMISCPQASQNPYEGLASRNFWAYNFETEKYYSVDSVQLAEGEKCIVWAERSAWVPLSTGKAVATEYDTKIYPKIVGTFGSEAIMENGDMDKNGKLTLLLLNIQDDSQISGAYMAGYFYNSDLLSSNSFEYSNEMDMIYVDTYPSKLRSEDSYATIAHELQHFINYAARRFVYKYDPMDTWIDEGLSAAAEYIYLGKQNETRVAQFSKSETVQRGNNFFMWGNDEASLLDEYSTVYLFFQWLRIQSGGNDIYRRIIESPRYDYRAVVEAISGSFAGALGSTDWETTLRSWLAANYINSPDGLYGYRGELPELRVYALGERTWQLLPGEGVYSIAGGSPDPLPSGGGPNIKYAGLRKAADSLASPPELPLSLDALYPNGRLLTFNSNEANKGGVAKELGVLTGKGETMPKSPAAGTGRSAWQTGDSWIIDARDLLGRGDRGDD